MDQKNVWGMRDSATLTVRGPNLLCTQDHAPLCVRAHLLNPGGVGLGMTPGSSFSCNSIRPGYFGSSCYGLANTAPHSPCLPHTNLGVRRVPYEHPGCQEISILGLETSITLCRLYSVGGPRPTSSTDQSQCSHLLWYNTNRDRSCRSSEVAAGVAALVIPVGFLY